MSQEPQVQRLVTFLGKPKKGAYDKTNYRLSSVPPQTYESEFVAEALASFLKPREVVILATDEAWQGQGAELDSRFKKLGIEEVRREVLASGQTEGELWSQFEVLKKALRYTQGAVALDITHGFRSQPFFAAGAVTFLHLVDATPPEIKIYYGAFEAPSNDHTPIWDLTPFSDLIAWSSHIMIFLKTGRSEGLAEATELIGRYLRKEWARGDRQGEAPSLNQLGQALAKFGGDLETVRTGSLMMGKDGASSSASSLDKELAKARTTASSAIPPLADVLDRMASMLRPLQTDRRLSDPEGVKALQELAKLYYQMGRYAEAASTMREAYINQHACSQSDCPGQPGYSGEHRDAAEKAWFSANECQAKEIAQVRNDIEHAGYNNQPMPPNAIKKKIKELIDKLNVEESKEDA